MADQKNKRKGLSGQIEKITTNDTLHNGPEDFVRPLVEEIVTTRLPEIDLTTKESAAKAAAMLGDKLSELNRYQERVHKLKALLEQKKFDLSNE